jgi:PAS domain S-box-containing protein
VITDAVPALISYIDRDQRYRFVNREYQRWFGLPSQEVLGKTMTEVLGEAAVERLSPYIEKALGGEEVRFELETPYRDGGTRWIDAHYIPDRDRSGQIGGLFVLVSDISERRRSEQALAEASRQQEVLYRFLERQHRADSGGHLWSGAQCDFGGARLRARRDPAHGRGEIDALRRLARALGRLPRGG